MRRLRIGSTYHPANSPPVDNRRGAALIFAMIAMLLASVIGSALLKTALTQRRQARHSQNQSQSEWLVESGIERAVSMLAADAKYKGEIWNINATELGGTQFGRVVIQVVPNPSDVNSRRVTVTAEFPIDTEKRTRSHKTIEVNLRQLTPQETSK